MRFVGRSSDVPVPAPAFWAAHGCPSPARSVTLRSPSRYRDARVQGAHTPPLYLHFGLVFKMMLQDEEILESKIPICRAVRSDRILMITFDAAIAEGPTVFRSADADCGVRSHGRIIICALSVFLGAPSPVLGERLRDGRTAGVRPEAVVSWFLI